MERYLEIEISRLRGLLKDYEHVLNRVRTENNKFFTIKLVERLTEKCDRKKNRERENALENALLTARVDAFNTALPPYIEVCDRIPWQFRFGPEGNCVKDTFLGQWVRIQLYEGASSPSKQWGEHQVGEYIQAVYQDSNGPYKFNVSTPGVIVEYRTFGDNLYAIVRYFDSQMKPCSTSICDHEFGKISHPKLVQWMYRHKFNRIRRHMRKWIEHIRFKPGGEGYEQSLESWNKCTKTQKYNV